MVKILMTEDCGNAPKQKVVFDFLAAVANMQIDPALSMLTDDVRLEIVGTGVFEGQEEVRNLILKDGGKSAITTMEIFNIISHGKICAANGTWSFDDGSKVAFNNMYFFENHSQSAKIKTIITYSLVLPSS